MKKLILTLSLALALITAAGLFAQGSAKSKMLVVYFSWSGTTEKAAQMIAKSTGADLFRIEPTEDYPTPYKDLTDIVKKELADGKIRTVKSAPDFAKYDTVFIGVPVWCHTAPTLMTHFLEAHVDNIKGKTVIPFCTYYSTYRDETLATLTDATPTAQHKEGYGTTNPKQGDIDAWLKKIGVIK